MKYRKILVPLDGSTLSEKALPFVIRLANRLEAEVMLLKVVEPHTLLATTRHHRQQALHEGLAYLHQVRRVITGPDLKPALKPDQVQTVCVYGSPVEEISAAAATGQADMIMMTTHGRSGLSRLVAGSIASRVLHHVTLPVMLVRPTCYSYEQLLLETLYGIGETGINCFEGSGGQLLLALDGTPEASAAIKPALELAQKLKATLHLLRVTIPGIPAVYGDIAAIGFDQDQIDWENSQGNAQAQSYLDEIEARISKDSKGVVKCVTVVRTGDAAVQILAYSREIGSQAVVLATHARGEVGKFFLGSVPQDVMRASHLPVLMVPTATHMLKKAEEADPEQATATVAAVKYLNFAQNSPQFTLGRHFNN